MTDLLKKTFGSLFTTGWSFMRILRFAMGTAALIFAWQSHDMLLGVAGGFLLLMGVLNLGCCGAGSCRIPPAKNQKEK